LRERLKERFRSSKKGMWERMLGSLGEILQWGLGVSRFRVGV